MSENGPVNPDEPAGPKREPDRTRQLFGHRSGARPWEQAPERPGEPQAKTSAEPSSPYPRDARYTPRPEKDPAPNAPSILGEVDDDGELTKLHPNYKLLMRIGALFAGLAIVVAGVVGDGILQSQDLPVPFGILTVPAVLIALFIVIRLPYSRFNARGYQISRDRLRVVRGILWHSDTVVPFGRVQHIDVDQGPIERALDIATLTLHTAGNHNSSVQLPGLGHELAVEMREEIRAHIKRESL